MRAVLRMGLADVRRRRLQTGVIALVTLLSALAATMALSLLVESNAPYDHAFARANGPHLVATFDGARASAEAAAATSHSAGVVRAVGPWPAINTTLEFTLRGPFKGSTRLALPATLVGRERPDSSVDVLTMVDGRWAQTGEEIVLSRDLAARTMTAVGSTVHFPQAAGTPSRLVVGVAASISPASDAWVTPATVPSLVPVATSDKAPSGLHWVMEYRLADPSDKASIRRALAVLSSQVPADSVLGSVSWLDVKHTADLTAAVMVPFLVVFSALGLLAAAFVISNVVAGVVIAERRQMGIMKSIGFTPRQVTGVLLLEVLAPALFGCLVGIPLGTAASRPFLERTAHALGLPAVFGDTALVDLAVLLLVTLIALAAVAWPAARAGRMSTVAAISFGTGPSSARGAGTIAKLTRVRLPAPARLGLADLAGRPVRAIMTGLAVLLGVATVVFAVALTLSLQAVADSLTRSRQVQVSVSLAPDQPSGNLEELIRSTPGTSRSVGEGQGSVTVPGVATPIRFYGYAGDSTWLGFAMISGRWFTAPGEVVAPSHLMDVAGLRLGDRFPAGGDGKVRQLTLVGEVFDQTDDNLLLRGSWTDVAGLDPKIGLDRYEVQLRPGTDARQYASALQTLGGPSVGVNIVETFSAQTAFLLIESVLSGLAMVLAGIAAAGVLNTVVLGTRERRREIAILKAIGMEPRQVVVMVVFSVALVGLAAGIIGAPLGLVMHHQILALMGEIATNTRVPASFYSVLGPAALMLLALTGMAIATVGAWLPAQWAAREAVAAALQAE